MINKQKSLAVILASAAALWLGLSASAYQITFVNTKEQANPNATTFDENSELAFQPLANTKTYAFVEWLPAGISKGTAGDLTVTAVWEKLPYLAAAVTNEVIFLLGEHGYLQGSGGSRVTQVRQLVESGESANPPHTNANFVVESGWRFVGWDKDYTVINSDTQLNAVYEMLPTTCNIQVTYDTQRGSVSGIAKSGVSSFNLKTGKLTLKATAKKGYSFVNWTEVTAAGVTNPISNLAYLILDNTGKTKATTTKFVKSGITEDAHFVANFLSAAEEAQGLKVVVNGMSLESGATLATNLLQAVGVEWPVFASSELAKAVTVKGLPTGLSYKNGVISGFPTTTTKAGKPKVVSITVTLPSKNKVVYSLAINIQALPQWAIVSFTGPAYADETGCVTNGVADALVSKAGKITLKQPFNGKRVTFSAKGFVGYDEAAEALYAEVTYKKGKQVFTNEVVITENAVSELGYWSSTCADLWGYNWKIEPWKSLAKVIRNRKYYYYTPAGDTIVLTFGSSGKVTIKGTFGTTSASGSTYLLPLGNDDFIVNIYLTPRQLPAYAECLKLHWNSAIREFE